MLVFREIEVEVREVKERLALLGVEVDTSLDEKRLDLLLRIVGYVNSYIWLSHERTAEKLKFFLIHGYEYRVTAVKFGVSVKSLHVSVSYAGARLKKRLGNALELLKSGDIPSAEREFALGTGSCSSDIFIGIIRDRFEPVKDSGVDLNACEKELSFLSYFTNRNMTMVLDTLDRQRLEHLLFILLQNDSSYLSERGVLFRCLEGELEAVEALALIKGANIYNAPTISEDEL